MIITKPEKIVLKAHNLQFTALTMGDGALVICLHGFPDHFLSFREQMPVLAEAGFKVIAPMLRGYEPSSQPADNNYYAVSIAKDVIEWINNLKAERVHIIGHDWGAIIGYLAAVLEPQKIITLTMLAIPTFKGIQKNLIRYPSQFLKSWYMIFFQLRGIAEYFVQRNDYAFINMIWRHWSPGWNFPPEDMQDVKQTFRQRGVTKAALDYYRSIFSVWPMFKKEIRGLLETSVKCPMLILTGALDGCLDTRIFDHINPQDFPAGIQMKRIQNAGHFLHQEKPLEVNQILLNWLSSNK